MFKEMYGLTKYVTDLASQHLQSTRNCSNALHLGHIQNNFWRGAGLQVFFKKVPKFSAGYFFCQ